MSFLSKFEKWNNLSNELKLACMNHMDLKTRISIRGTCHAERNLSDSQKFDIEFIETEELQLYICEKRSQVFIKMKRFRFDEIPTVIIPFLTFLFQNARVKIFGSACRRKEEGCENILEKIERGSTPFQISLFGFDSMTSNDVGFLEKCDRIKEVSFYYCQNDVFPVDRFVQCTSLNSTKEWNLTLNNMPDIGEKIVRKWISMDLKLDSELRIRNWLGNRTIQDFVAAFEAEEIVEHDNEIVRLRMENKKKHIVMRMIRNHPEDTFCVIRVVPVDFPRQNYDDIY